MISKFKKFGGNSRREPSTVVHVPQKFEEPPNFISSSVIRTSTPYMNKPRVLCFTPSRHRPGKLLRCILQIQTQTYPADHAVFMNDDNGDAAFNYESLIHRMVKKPNSTIYLAFGKSGRQHHNYMQAVCAAPFQKYDLFLKIDDDDMYASDYIAECVRDWVGYRWDFSGCHSFGYLDQSSWKPDRKLASLGETSQDIDLNVVQMMPPTYAMSPAAMACIMNIEDDGVRHEDQQWRCAVAADSKLTMRSRRSNGFIYNIHDSNISKPSCRQEPQDKSERDFTCAIITAGRKEGVSDTTIKHLVSEGFELLVYAEPDAVFKNIKGASLALRNKTSLGPLKNTHSAIRDMCRRFPNSKYYILFQDDVEVTPGLREFCKAFPWPSGVEVISLYTMQNYLDDHIGWRILDLGYYRTFGAQAFVLSNRAAKMFVEDRYVVSKVSSQRTGADAVIGEWASRNFGGIAYHTPSLVRHVETKSTLRHWRFSRMVYSQIPASIDAISVWSPAKETPIMGLAGWNTAQGLGYLNRDIVEHLPIDTWIIPKHPRFAELDDIKGCKSIHTHVNENEDRLRSIIQKLDWMLFCELTYIKNFAGIVRSCGVANVCVPMWEWLHKDLDWLKYIDIFLCPTKACYDMLKKWRHENGLKWDLHYIPWPIDTDKFEFKQRSKCNRILFNNGTGGVRPRQRNGKQHGPRKSLDVVLAAARNLPHIPFTIMSQVPVEDAPSNVEVRPPAQDNATLYDVGDVALQPSRCEGLGLQLLECQACGMPLITTDAPPMNEHNPMAAVRCKSSEGRFIGDRWVDVYEPNLNHLCEVIEGVYGTDISELSRISREFVESTHSWHVQADRILSILTR